MLQCEQRASVGRCERGGVNSSVSNAPVAQHNNAKTPHDHDQHQPQGEWRRYSQLGDSTASTLQRWVPFSSPSARPTLRSSVPNMFRGCLKYSSDRCNIMINFVRCTVPLRLC